MFRQEVAGGQISSEGTGGCRWKGGGQELKADLCSYVLGRRLPEVGAVVEGLEDAGGRAEVGNWRPNLTSTIRPSKR